MMQQKNEFRVWTHFMDGLVVNIGGKLSLRAFNKIPYL
jgi:hypothetical protein